VDHGFAWLSVNYRGSITFGREFEEALWGNVGRVDVDDVVSARAWMVEQGHAGADQVLLTGWSYGGFLTLQALGRFPDLWAGGMAGIAVADWVQMYEHSADTLKGYVVALFGGTPDDHPERYREGSPITYAGDVQAPVLVIQGKNDSRCPAEQLLAYERRMRELGREIEVEWFDAGHGALDVEVMVRHQELMLRFAHRVLGLPEGTQSTDPAV
jgi:dipeptidyl aminopeptidase/acylaminoacyl peptidase